MTDSIKSEEVSFSILMANYNNANYIRTSLESIISQSYSNWELIIIDDCSTDNSIQIIQEFLNEKKIKFIEHKENLGYGGTLKTAGENASNDILCVVDADDKLHKDALKKMAEAYKSYPNFGFIYSTMWICDSNLDNCVIAKNIGPIIPEKTAIYNLRISHFKTFKKEAYNATKGFEICQKRSVDKDIIYKLEEVTSFKFINEPLYYYRKHQAGISQLKNQPKAFFYHYIAKCKTYRRRLDTNLPNFKKIDLYKDYFLITFRSLLNFRKKLVKRFRINILIRNIQKRYPKLSLKFQNVLIFIGNDN